MFKTMTVMLAMGALLGAQKIERVTIQSTPIPSAASGEGMFKAYCAACHGALAKGDGPAAAALKKRPADLTQLARKNNGKFPEMQVIDYIRGYDVVAAHGSRDMPIWGTLFRSIEATDSRVPDLRAKNLADYVKTLQAR